MTVNSSGLTTAMNRTAINIMGHNLEGAEVKHRKLGDGGVESTYTFDNGEKIKFSYTGKPDVDQGKAYPGNPFGYKIEYTQTDGDRVEVVPEYLATHSEGHISVTTFKAKGETIQTSFGDINNDSNYFEKLAKIKSQLN